jgi:hypothetical protein
MSGNSEIDKIINSFYSVFTNANGAKPDFTTLHKICIPEIIIIKKQGLDQTIYNLESFIAPRKTLLTDGSLIDFWEAEQEDVTTVKGHIAQRFSHYRKKGVLNEVPFDQNGNKFFHLILTNKGWKISSVTWEDDKLTP